MRIEKPITGVVIVKLTRNFGAISAVKAGLSYCNGDCFLFLAADLQDPPDLIVEMANAWLSGEKYIIAVREERKDPWQTRLFSNIYYRLLRKFVLPEYPTKGFDLALMDKDILPYLKNIGKHVNFPLFPYWLGYKAKKIIYTRQVRQHGKSKWTFLKKSKLLFD